MPVVTRNQARREEEAERARDLADMPRLSRYFDIDEDDVRSETGDIDSPPALERMIVSPTPNGFPIGAPSGTPHASPDRFWRFASLSPRSPILSHDNSERMTPEPEEMEIETVDEDFGAITPVYERFEASHRPIEAFVAHSPVLGATPTWELNVDHESGEDVDMLYDDESVDAQDGELSRHQVNIIAKLAPLSLDFAAFVEQGLNGNNDIEEYEAMEMAMSYDDLDLDTQDNHLVVPLASATPVPASRSSILSNEVAQESDLLSGLKSNDETEIGSDDCMEPEDSYKGTLNARERALKNQLREYSGGPITGLICQQSEFMDKLEYALKKINEAGISHESTIDLGTLLSLAAKYARGWTADVCSLTSKTELILVRKDQLEYVIREATRMSERSLNLGIPTEEFSKQTTSYIAHTAGFMHHMELLNQRLVELEPSKAKMKLLATYHNLFEAALISRKDASSPDRPANLALVNREQLKKIVQRAAGDRKEMKEITKKLGVYCFCNGLWDNKDQPKNRTQLKIPDILIDNRVSEINSAVRSLLQLHRQS